MKTRPADFVVLLAIGLLLALAMFAPPSAENPQPGRVDAGTHYVETLSNHKALREAIETHETIGYTSDEPIDIRVGGAAQMRYYLAQFALAPVLLDLDITNHELVLLSFVEPRSMSAFLREHTLRKIIAVNDHIALAQREARR